MPTLAESSRRIVQQVKEATGFPEDPEAFTGEHSVGVLIPFVKYYFPHTRVVPILVDVNAQENRLKELRRVLSVFLQDPHVLRVARNRRFRQPGRDG
ncbi:MAG: AmmeMemoRadiSam system protein B [Terriglobia bacterium]